MSYIVYESQLCHSGIKGQKHGIRRFQNPDGSLTPLGRVRYGVGKKKKSAKRPEEKSDYDKESDDSTATKKPLPSTVTESQSVKKPQVNQNGKVDSSSARGKSLSEMSDAELRAVIDRLGLEQQLKKMTYKPSAMDSAKGLVKKMANNIIEDYGTQLAKYVIGTGINKIAEDAGYGSNIIRINGNNNNNNNNQKKKDNN